MVTFAFIHFIFPPVVQEPALNSRLCQRYKSQRHIIDDQWSSFFLKQHYTGSLFVGLSVFGLKVRDCIQCAYCCAPAELSSHTDASLYSL